MRFDRVSPNTSLGLERSGLRAGCESLAARGAKGSSPWLATRPTTSVCSVRPVWRAMGSTSCRNGMQNGYGEVPAPPGRITHSTEDRKALVRSARGLSSTSVGRPDSRMTPPSMKISWSPTSRAKPISWVTTTIVMPEEARSFIT